MANPEVIVKIGGDSRGLKTAVAEGLRELSRLEAAQKRLMGGKAPTASFAGLNNLSSQELREIDRISRARQQAATADARVSAQARISEIRSHEQAERTRLRISEQTERARLNLIQQSARARQQAELAASRAVEAQRRRDFQVEQRQIREQQRAQNAAIRSRSASAVGGRLQSVGEGTRNAGFAASAGITAPFVAGAAAVLTAGVEYEKALNVFQSSTKATEEAMKAAAKEARALGADISLPATSAKDAAIAMSVLAKGGLEANDAIAASRGALQVAAAGQLEVAQAADIAVSALNAFGLSGNQAGRVADVLAASSEAAQGSIGDMAQGFQQASASFREAGFSIEDMASGISLLAKSGIQASDAGTSLRTFVSRLTAPTDVAAEAMKKLGVNIFDLATGDVKDLPNIIGQFSKALEGLSDQERLGAIQTIFGEDAGRAAKVLFREGEQGFNAMKAKVSEVGAAARVAAALAKGLGGAFQAFQSQLETIGVDLFEIVKVPLTNFMKDAANAVGAVGVAFGALPVGVQQAIILFAALAATLGPVLIIVGAVVSAIGTLATALGAVAGFAGFATVGAAFSAILPLILPVVAALAAAGAAAYALYVAWETNFANIQGIAAEFSGVISTAFSDLLTVVQPAIDAVRDYALEGFGQISAYWSENGAEIAEAVSIALTAVVGVVRDTVDLIRRFWATNGEAIIESVTTAWNGVKSIISGVAGIIGGVIKTIGAVIRGDWAAAWAGLGAIVTGAIRTVVGIIQGSAGLIYGALRVVVGGLLAFGSFIYEQGSKLGIAIGQGIINGMSSMVGAVVNAGRNLAIGAYNAAKNALGIQSPSKEFFRLGAFLVEGFTGGIETNTPKAKSAVRQMADDTIKEMNDALKNFSKIASLSPEQQARTNQTEDLSKATSDLREIIRLRNQLGENTQNPLPSTIAGVNSELGFLKDKLEAAERAQKSFEKSLDAIQDGYDDAQDAVRKYHETLSERQLSITDAGQDEALRLQEEIELLGVTDALEQQRIKNAYELLRLRAALKADGFVEADIENLIKARQQTQTANIPLVRQRVEREKQVDAERERVEEIKKQAEDVKRQIEGITEDIADSFSSVFNTFARKGIRAGFSSIVDELKSFGSRLLSGLIDSFSKSIAQSIAGSIFGGGSGAGGGGNLGRLFGGGGASGGTSSGGGSFLGRLLGIGGTAGFNPNAANFLTPPAFSQGGLTADTNLIPSNISGARGSGSSLGSLLNGLGGGTSQGNLLQRLFGRVSGTPGIGGGLLGASLGASLGGSSRVGQGLGIAGGLIGGTLLTGLLTSGSIAGATTGGLFGATAGLFGLSGAATFGIGAAVAGIALLASHFIGRSAARRRDEQARTGFLRDGIGSLSQIDELISGVRTLRIEPETATQQATAIAAQVRSQYLANAQSLKDKKTREIALRSVSELDYHIGVKLSQLKAVTDGANAAIDRRNRIIPEFASGGFMDAKFAKQFSEFKKRNGMLPGTFTGRDTLPAMLAEGEMVLNPEQQRRIIEAARHDIFRNKGIPGYATGTFITPTIQPSVQTPVYQNQGVAAQTTQTVIEPVLKLYINGVIPIEDKIEAYLESEDGKRTQAEVFIDNRRKNKI